MSLIVPKILSSLSKYTHVLLFCIKKFLKSKNLNIKQINKHLNFRCRYVNMY